jgi:hypothetical protein
MSLVSSDAKSSVAPLARTITLGIVVGGMVERASERTLAKHDTRRLDRAVVESIMASTISTIIVQARYGGNVSNPTKDVPTTVTADESNALVFLRPFNTKGQISLRQAGVDCRLPPRT